MTTTGDRMGELADDLAAHICATDAPGAALERVVARLRAEVAAIARLAAAALAGRVDRGEPGFHSQPGGADMTGRSLLVTVNGAAVWAFVTELDGGLAVRLSLDDWERLDLHRGQRVPVRLPGGEPRSLCVAEVRDEPPVAWVTLVERVRAAG